MSYKPYPTYKDSGVEWLGEIPEGWKVSKTKYICSCNSEVLPEDNNPDMEINYIEISDVRFGLGITQTTSLTFGNAPSRARRIVHSGDIIISTVRTYLRAIAKITTQFEGAIVSTGFAVLRPLKDHPNFIHYLFHAGGLHEEIITRSTGVSYPAINAQDLIAIPIPLPPLPTQKAITAFLDVRTGQIDRLVQDYEELIALLKEKRQALVSHAVTRGLSELVSPDDPKFGEWARPVAFKDSGVEWLGEIPEGWEVQRIGRLYREVNEEGSSELPILSVSIHHGVSDKELSDEDLDRKVTRSEEREKYKRVLPNDLTYNMMRAWQGGFGAVAVEGMVSPAYVVARPIGSILSAYFEGVLRTPNAVEQMRVFSRGVTDFRLRLYWDEFRTIQVPLPSHSEQQAILNFLQCETAKIDTLVAEAEGAIELLKERRSALITAAVTGKINVEEIEVV